MGKTGTRTAVAIGLLVVSSLTMPAAALGRDTVRVADFQVEATNGYHASIEAFKRIHPRRQARISVFVSNRDGYAQYVTHGRFTKRQIKARLGDFGVIKLRRAARRGAVSSQESKAPDSHGPARASSKVRFCIISLAGRRRAYRGRVRFRGEDAYTRIRTNEVHGFVGSGDISCSESRSARGTVLTAASGSLEFDAATYRRDPGPYLYAEDHRTQGRVRLGKAAVSFEAGDIFTFDSGLTSAHVEPAGAPFTGSADFASPDQWTGDLSASFPGEPEVSLAGPEFTARLRHVGG